jgi:hypothetical protein
MILFCHKKGNSYQLSFLHWPYQAILRGEDGKDIKSPSGAPIEDWYCCKCHKTISATENSVLNKIREVYLSRF